MDSSKRKIYERRYKIARRKLDRNNIDQYETDSDDDISKQSYVPKQFRQEIEKQIDNPPAILVDNSLNLEMHRDSDEPLSDMDICLTEGSKPFHIMDDSSSEGENDSISKQLSVWATSYNVSHNAIDSLLKILKENGHACLPATARTLLHSQTTVQTQIISGMEYYCFGVKEQLIRYINMATEAGKEVPNEIQLSLNIDGLPVFRSSRKSLWPILGLISNITPSVVFPIVITCGDGKPNNLRVSG